MINDLDIVQWEYLLSPEFELINSAGKPLTGGWIEVYLHGTRDKYYCASDFSGTLHPFQIPLDSIGANVVLADPNNAYDVYVYNKFGSLIMSRYNVKCHGGGSGSSTYVGDRLYYGQFKATDVATQASLTRVKGNIDLDNGMLELKQDMSYHITLRGEFVVNEVSNVDTVLSYIEYSAVKPINVNVDYTKDGSQYFEISYDIYRLAEDMDYPVSFLQSNGLVKNLVVEVHSLSNLATTASGGGSEYDPGWGINITNNVISVDPSILEDFTTTEEVMAIVSGITGVGPGEVYTAGDYISIEDNTISVTGIDPQEYATHDEVYNSSVTAINLVTGIIPEAQVQSDWDQEDDNEPDYIKNKPHIPTIELNPDSQVTAIDGHTLAGTGGSEYNEGFGIDIDNGTISIDTNIVALASAIPPAQVQSDWEQSDDAQVDFIKNKPDLEVYSTHEEVYNATVTAVQVATGAIPELPEEEEVEFEEINLGDYALASAIPDVSNFATHTEVYEATVTAINLVTGIIPEAQVQSDWNQNDDSKPDYIKNKPTIPSVEGLATIEQVSAVSGYLQNEINNIPGQVQSDWAQDDNTQVDFIKNKPDEYDLVAGQNVSISVSGTNVVISSTGGSGGGGTYTEGLGIDITNNVISLDNPVQLVAGDNVSISVSGVSAVISAQGGGTSYTAGTGIDITSDVISIDNTVALKTDIPNVSNFATKTELTSVSGTLQSEIEAVSGIIPEEEEVEFEEINLNDYALTSAIPTIELDGDNQVTAIDGHTLAGGSGGGSTYTEGFGIDIFNDEISIDPNIVALVSAIPADKLFIAKANSPSTTKAELDAALAAGKAIFCKVTTTTYGTSLLPMTRSGNDYVFMADTMNMGSYGTETGRKTIVVKYLNGLGWDYGITDSCVTKSELNTAIAGIGTYTAGEGIDINNNVISVDDTEYISYAASGIMLPNSNFELDANGQAYKVSSSTSTITPSYYRYGVAFFASGITFPAGAYTVNVPTSATKFSLYVGGTRIVQETVTNGVGHFTLDNSYVTTSDEEGNMLSCNGATLTGSVTINVRSSGRSDTYAMISDIPTVQLDGNNQVTAIDGHTLAGGSGGSSYTAGTGIDITNDVISVDNTVALKSDIPSTASFATKAELTAVSGTLQSEIEAVSGIIPELPDEEEVEFETIDLSDYALVSAIPDVSNFTTHAEVYEATVSAVQLATAQIPDVSDMATQTWVGNQGYLTEVPNTYATDIEVYNATVTAINVATGVIPDTEDVIFEEVDLSDYALTSAIPDTSDMATKTWVGNQGYLTSVPSNYVTETELTGAVSGFQNKLTGINDVQVVASLPASPVSNTLYLIPEGV